MIVYIDKNYKCHSKPAEGLTEIDLPFFDGKSPYFIEGYIHIPFEGKFISENGEMYEGITTTPWKDYNLLAAYQEQYENDKEIYDALNILIGE